MSDKEFLLWIAERMVSIYGENPNIDFLHRLRSLAEKIEELENYKFMYESVSK